MNSLVQPLHRFRRHFFTWQMTSIRFAALWSLVMVLIDNLHFFRAVNQLFNVFTLGGALFVLCLALLLWLLTFIVISLVILPYISKPLMMVLLVAAAATAYFMNAYGIVIHKLMIQNLMETDVQEVSSLLSVELFGYLLMLGVLPAILVVRCHIVYEKPMREIWHRLKIISMALLLAIALILSMSSQFASFFRNHKDVRQMANPLNFIYAGIAYAVEKDTQVVVKPIGEDAQLNARGLAATKPTLLIVVVGETARADHFSINGYERATTPLLAQQPIINYSSVTSCGTETAISVPCMFSQLPRKDYSDRKAKEQESVLDVMHRAGVPVLWRDNNSGCKGTCDRVAYEDMRALTLPDLCNKRECFDDVLLHELEQKVGLMPAQGIGHKVVVLHQKGSHGPDYYHRYPESAEVFTPACHTNQLQECSREEVVNAFDNTIHYTDQFLVRTIQWLESQSNYYNTAMVYLSDHGESLGENGLYLHGMPYMIAPTAQKHVPFFFWFSPGFERDNHIDRQCLIANSSKDYSQDNLFHTLLGLMNIDTTVYQAPLDMLGECRAR